jgi:hypothetical protein
MTGLTVVTDAAPEPKAIQKPQPTTVDGKFPPPPPVFKYQAPIENPLLVKSVIQRALGSQISISNEELCAISPDFRKYYRENTAPTVHKPRFKWAAPSQFVPSSLTDHSKYVEHVNDMKS